MPRGINQFDEDRLDGLNFGDANSSNIVAPSIVTDGLILHLDAGNYQSYPISGTTWYDLSDRRNDGTLTGGPPYVRDGGGAIDFDGTNDFINCGTGLALSGSWTLSSFVRTTVSSAAQVILCRTGGASSFPQNYSIYISQNKFFCQTSADSYKNTESTTTVATNTWYYVTGLYNSSSKILSIYVNGNFEASSTALVQDPPTTGAQYVTLGASDGLAAANRLTGNIAFAQIYNRVLTPTEVSQNFNALRARFNV